MVLVDEDGEDGQSGDEEDEADYHLDELSVYIFGYLMQYVPWKLMKQETRPDWRSLWSLSDMGGLL